MTRIGYTVEELAEASGLAIGTIQNFTSYNILPKPVRGAVPGGYSSKGLYPLHTMDCIRRYKELKHEGLRMPDIIKLMQIETTTDGGDACIGTGKMTENRRGN